MLSKVSCLSELKTKVVCTAEWVMLGDVVYFVKLIFEFDEQVLKELRVNRFAVT